jgi:hypothetical protein
MSPATQSPPEDAGAHLAAGPGTGLSTAVGAATCGGCGAPLAPDQRYCLACGRPASPVRLAFLDVLQAERQPAGPGLPGGSQIGAYITVPQVEPAGVLGALRRYSGLLGLLAVLLAALLIGLLVGHWMTAGSSTGGGKQVVEVKGLGGASLAAAPATATTTPAAHSTAGSKSSGGAKTASAPKSEKAQEAQEVKELAKAKPPVAHKDNTKVVEKLSHTTGKKHEEEANKLINGDEPIETK